MADNPEGFYEVEKILKSRKNAKGKMEYFLKWKGFPSSANSWEPSSNVTDDLIKDYKERQKAAKESKAKGKPTSTAKPASKATPQRSQSKSEPDVAPSTVQSARIAGRKRKAQGEGSSSEDPGVTDREEAEARELYAGLTPKEVNGIARMADGLFLRMKWENSEDDDLIPSKICNVLYPQQVIAFYEKNLKFLD